MNRVADLTHSLIALLERFPSAPLHLFMRIAVASVFWRSGQVKIASWEPTVMLFEFEYQVPLLPPEIAAYLATGFELACPVLLVLGLGTRFAAGILLSMTAVIQFMVYPESWPDHILWAAILAFLVTRGGGMWSLDHLIGGRFFPQSRMSRV